MLVLHASGFDWDSGNRAKCQKHGVSLEDIETVFRSDPMVAPDPLHSSGEYRMIAVGRTRDQRPIFVAFTMRTRDGQRLIRPVSARYMHAKEIKAFEEENT